MVKIVPARCKQIQWQANNKSQDLWTNMYQWVKSNKLIVQTKFDNLIQYYIPAGDETNIIDVEIDLMKKMKWYSFDQYKINAFNIWSIILPIDKLKYLDEVRDCPAFFKKFMCKHVAGMAIGLNYWKLPLAAKNVRIAAVALFGLQYVHDDIVPVAKSLFAMSSTVGAVILRTDTASSAKKPISSRKENAIRVRFEIAA
ncbi:unnamed protein product [Rotaria sp. Silwood1]|nr:unnamed protein product [Rotaria sp. Silwood1]CAF1451681.1 unnamed protein product [Rotaria sp. Silwood1]